MAGGAISRVVERGWKHREVTGGGDMKLPRFGYVATKAAPYSCNLTISGLKPESYKVQCESRVLSLASGAAPVRLYIYNWTRDYMKENMETKESIPILGTQDVRLLLQAGLCIGP